MLPEQIKNILPFSLKFRKINLIRGGRYDVLPLPVTHRRCEIAAIRLRIAVLRAACDALKAGFNKDQSRNPKGQWDGGRGGSSVVVVRRDRTDNAKIDLAADRLIDVVKDVVAKVGPGRGSVCRTVIHSEAAKLISHYDLPDVGPRGVGQSFSMGDLVRYGLDGSIRTDAILRDGRTVAAPILAVFDIKTGGARLTREACE
ncbi:hypothetical protein [Methylobacterium sp. M6A4_1b]